MLLEFSLTTDDYVAFNEHVARTSPVIRRNQTRGRAFSTVVCLAVSLLLVGLAFEDWIGGLVVGVIVAAGSWFLYPRLDWWLVTRNLRRLAASGGAGPIGHVRLTLTGAGITEELSGTTTSVTWEGIDRVNESDDHYFVFTAPLAGLVIPRRASGSAEFIADVRSRSRSV